MTRIFSPNPTSSDEVADMLRSAENESIIDAGALQIMEGALKVSDLQAREIMIPRSQMKFIEADLSLEEILNIVIQSQHSRFPVVGESSDDIQGILLAKELLPLVLSGKESFNLKSMLRPATIIPESKRINILLQEFREQRYHMAIVIDEYAGVSGLLTIEDVLEEIVGEIEDETDEHEPEQIQKIDVNRYTVDAITEIADFNEYFDVGLSDDEFDTIAGLVIHELGRLPEVSETVEIGNFHFTVTAGDSRKITLLEVSKKTP
ncbi:MAG: CBS domain-containing protein [Porticoccaceae bacterium]|nr:CBS domain-containing protein [Porticoccaceae bacterium]